MFSVLSGYYTFFSRPGQLAPVLFKITGYYLVSRCKIRLNTTLSGFSLFCLNNFRYFTIQLS